MATKHKDFLSSHCRVCSKSLGNAKYNCEKYPSVLGCLGIDISSDDALVHPPFFCNVCYVTAKRISQSSQHRTSIIPVEWVPHSDEGCLVCDVRSKGGRPKKRKSDGRPTLLCQHVMSVCSSTIPQFELSQLIDKTDQNDLKCCSCGLAANKPVEIVPCKSLMCSSCCFHLTYGEVFECPGCQSLHKSPESFTKPSLLVEKQFLHTLVRCSKCYKQTRIENINKDCSQHNDEIHDLTLRDIVNQPLEAEPTRMETDAAAHILSRTFRHKEANTSLKISTGGRVSKTY